ncbi:MAG: hypothetical protein DRI34_09450 [Deltaproteobacteria bacterium]|nr:MAG: hypothetical protein DRI34_09450 [Deltaproteobacteria bacterium]
MTRVIFLADAHLRGPADTNQQCLLEFLEAQTADVLVLVGDMFEYLAGRNYAAEDAYRPVLEALARFPRLHFFEGNHDFDLSPEIPGLGSCRLWPGGGLLTLDDRHVWVTHGDRASPWDLGTRLLRQALQSRPLRLLRDRVLPQSWLFRFALEFAGWSRRGFWPGRQQEAVHARRRAWRQGLAAGAQAVVFAHTHVALLQRAGPLLLANPGPAVRGGSYLELAGGVFSLRSMPDGKILPPGELELD